MPNRQEFKARLKVLGFSAAVCTFVIIAAALFIIVFGATVEALSR